MKQKTLYIAVTNDKYELPIRVEENGSNLARWAGIKTCHLFTYIKKGTFYKKSNCKFIKITIQEEK